MLDRSKPYGSSARGIAAADVSHAADTLLRAGERPTIEKIRQKIGRGSPNTINPLLDAWWRTIAARLDSGPAAIHRLPESIVHIAEALWMQALDEGRQRALQELGRTERLLTEQQQTFAVRSHVLTLREGELDSRLKDREKTIDDLRLQLRELGVSFRKERATRESEARRLITLKDQLLAQTSKRRAAQRAVKSTRSPRRRPRKRAAKFQKPLARRGSKASKAKPLKRRRNMA